MEKIEKNNQNKPFQESLEELKTENRRNTDYLKKAIRREVGFLYDKKPLEEWSDKERENFISRCIIRHCNNFFEKVSVQLRTAGYDQVNVSDVPIKIQRGKYAASKLKEGAYSKKFYNNSLKDFYQDIERALINKGVDINDLVKMLNRKQELRELAVCNYEKFDSNFRKEEEDVLLRVHIVLLPAMLDLIDSGYTEHELSA